MMNSYYKQTISRGEVAKHSLKLVVNPSYSNEVVPVYEATPNKARGSSAEDCDHLRLDRFETFGGVAWGIMGFFPAEAFPYWEPTIRDLDDVASVEPSKAPIEKDTNRRSLASWLCDRLDRWIRRREHKRTQALLSDLSDHTLRDIGLTRWDLDG
jgi:uncharacterized protein YjiS (DUF1127 family)